MIDLVTFQIVLNNKLSQKYTVKVRCKNITLYKLNSSTNQKIKNKTQ